MAAVPFALGGRSLRPDCGSELIGRALIALSPIKELLNI